MVAVREGAIRGSGAGGAKLVVGCAVEASGLAVWVEDGVLTPVETGGAAETGGAEEVEREDGDGEETERVDKLAGAVDTAVVGAAVDSEAGVSTQ